MSADKGKEMAEIKKDAQMSAKNHNYNNTMFLTMQIKDFNTPLSERQLQRRLKRQKRIRRKELIARIARYVFGFAMIYVCWVAITGLS